MRLKLVLEIDNLNLGNNFCYSHLEEAIANTPGVQDMLDDLSEINLKYDVEIKAKTRHGLVNVIYELGEFIGSIENALEQRVIQVGYHNAEMWSDDDVQLSQDTYDGE